MIAAYERVLARTPDAAAQADETGSVTFAGSYERSLRLAAGFAAHEIGLRQPVALLLDNSLDATGPSKGVLISRACLHLPGRVGPRGRRHRAPPGPFVIGGRS